MYSIVAEHNDFLVIDKQANVSIHNESGQGLIERLRQDFQTQTIYPVHRLDKPTSGLLLCAKNPTANSQLSQLFEQRQVEKYYLALSQQKPKKKQGLIIGDMQRTRNGNWKLLKSQSNPAVTQFFSYGIGQSEKEKGKRLFIIKPFTGKTHQIRVAMKSLGSPISGDKRYSSVADTAKQTHLHAYSLRFEYDHHQYHFTCLPKGECWDKNTIRFINNQLGEPWQLPWPILPNKIINVKAGRDKTENED